MPVFEETVENRSPRYPGRSNRSAGLGVALGTAWSGCSSLSGFAVRAVRPGRPGRPRGAMGAGRPAVAGFTFTKK